MNNLNDQYVNSCKPNYENYKKISKDIFLIENFFENFDKARNFFINRDVWKCGWYQNHSKCGYESLFPKWVGKSLLEKFIIDNNIQHEPNSYDVVCNFQHSEFFLTTVSNSGYFPHIDNIEIDNKLDYICLINLNKESVSTNFYSYRGDLSANSKNIDDFNNYNLQVTKNLRDFYKKNNITDNECKEFLNCQKQLDTKLVKVIEYNSNEAIIYPSNLFHSPNISEKFNKKNLRSILRICFCRKMPLKTHFNYL